MIGRQTKVHRDGARLKQRLYPRQLGDNLRRTSDLFRFGVGHDGVPSNSRRAAS